MEAKLKLPRIISQADVWVKVRLALTLVSRSSFSSFSSSLSQLRLQPDQFAFVRRQTSTFKTKVDIVIKLEADIKWGGHINCTLFTLHGSF